MPWLFTPAIVAVVVFAAAGYDTKWIFEAPEPEREMAVFLEGWAGPEAEINFEIKKGLFNLVNFI